MKRSPKITAALWKRRVSHDAADASLAMRAIWFQSLTAEQRLAWLASWQRMVRKLNHGDYPRKPHGRTLPGNCEVLECADGQLRHRMKK